MGALKNAYHDEICDRADTEALCEGGYSEAEIDALRRDSDGPRMAETASQARGEAATAGAGTASPE